MAGTHKNRMGASKAGGEPFAYRVSRPKSGWRFAICDYEPLVEDSPTRHGGAKVRREAISLLRRPRDFDKTQSIFSRRRLWFP